MYRIRLHGRGGQGIKTAGRMLGTAFFAEGLEVQDAPRYGAERRGAPIFATVRASRHPIYERGVIPKPDLSVVADDTLVSVATAGVLTGVREGSVLLIASAEQASVWKARLRLEVPVFTIPAGPDEGAEHRFAGAACAGATARLVDVISRASLEAAVREELADLGADVAAANLESALAAYDGFGAHAGCVPEGPDLAAASDERPDWVDLPLEPARLSAPDIHATATSVQVRTGLWRTMRPVIDHDRCHPSPSTPRGAPVSTTTTARAASCVSRCARRTRSAPFPNSRRWGRAPRPPGGDRDAHASHRQRSRRLGRTPRGSGLRPRLSDHAPDRDYRDAGPLDRGARDGRPPRHA
jgi:pyruvate ferredoxin oxidoreductase gamma subunit